MKANPTDIALIAAALANGKDPKGLVDAAIELHSACAARLANPTPTKEPDNRSISFNDFLLIMAPKDSPSRRKKLFSDFFSERILEPIWKATPEPYDELRLQRVTRENLEVFKAEGIAVGVANEYMLKFSQWRREKVSRNKAKGGRAKAEREADERRAREIEAKMKPAAVGKKNRMEYHQPDDLQAIAERQTGQGGRMTPRR